LIFGGTIATWRTEHNVSEDTVLPQICGDIFRCIAGLKADFETRNSENQVFAQAAKNKKVKQKWENTAFALWLQDLQATCMLAAIEHLRTSGVEVASLIHDGVLVKSSDENNIDLEELGE
jgi:outer membrane receptor for monomeric catechols